MFPIARMQPFHSARKHKWPSQLLPSQNVWIEHVVLAGKHGEIHKDACFFVWVKCFEAEEKKIDHTIICAMRV
jgi:hypothetical protein